jgi:hypothetical protein
VDVLEFAGEHDVAGGLNPILAVARTVFPASPLLLRLEEDPEVDDRQIVIEVDVTGWTVDEMFAAHNRWSPLFLEACASGEAYRFRLRMVQTA